MKGSEEGSKRVQNQSTRERNGAKRSEAVGINFLIAFTFGKQLEIHLKKYFTAGKMALKLGCFVEERCQIKLKTGSTWPKKSIDKVLWYLLLLKNLENLQQPECNVPHQWTLLLIGDGLRVGQCMVLARRLVWNRKHQGGWLITNKIVHEWNTTICFWKHFRQEIDNEEFFQPLFSQYSDNMAASTRSQTLFLAAKWYAYIYLW